MKPDSFLGVWTGTAHNNNGWDMEITVSIPEIPCSGTFRILEIRGETLELKAENQQGDCGEADSDSLESLSDGTLFYVSKGEGWEARGVLQRAS